MEDTLQEVFKGTASKDIDYIQYAIFLPVNNSNNDEEALLTYLKDTLDMINSLIQPIMKDYIWQKDKFHLSIAYEQTKDPPYPFLFGASRFGDCINDEWFIVYLLQYISKHIPDSIISLSDNDGDVLLIEAALELPSWLDPSNSQNRVYLMNGQVHIIPLPTSPADILTMPASSGKLTRQQAIRHLRLQQPSSKHTLFSPAIQHIISERLEQVSPHASNGKFEMHCARCILPKKAAFVLLSEPQLITLAIEAFYYRDPSAMKACASMKIFSPREDEDIDTILTFTKTTYAQTVSQKFYAPKPFRLPSNNASRKEDREKYKYAELGMKVTCGLEMLYYQHASSSLAETDMEDVDHYDFDKDAKYQAYLQHLNNLGYFRSEKKGSQLYKSLERQSKEQYLSYRKQSALHYKRLISLDDLDVEDEEVTFDGARLDTHVRQTIDNLLSHYSEEALQQLLYAKRNKNEDSDDWMNVDPQQLEEILMKRMGLQQKQLMSDLAKDMGMDGSAGVDLEAIMSNLEDFVEHTKSGIEGVEVFDKNNSNFSNGDDDNVDDDSDYSDYEEFEEDMGALSFDVDKFMSILKGTSSLESEGPETITPGSSQNDGCRIAEITGDDDVKDEEEKNLAQVMEDMDQEIYSHDKIGQSFVKTPKNPERFGEVEDGSESEDDEDEENVNAPVDIELNLVKNVLESFKSQQGLPGPVGTMLNQFGIVLPGDIEENDEQENEGGSNSNQ
ncbi:SGT1 protein-domain-containing protein [Mycotypha africana]|uniref:SGT1 protein-domain-containing protein n=1 Tax=Mycotypha africana TaxID=64632 RepID=UPI002301C33E|nr:SGT1 protein-domain-containing protein [Mycotypha africana]KAI8973465.1 SGT1 protein-domain-containing protein [Mycotypha africana]